MQWLLNSGIHQTRLAGHRLDPRDSEIFASLPSSQMVLSLSLGVQASQAEDHGPDGANEKSPEIEGANVREKTEENKSQLTQTPPTFQLLLCYEFITECLGLAPIQVNMLLGFHHNFDRHQINFSREFLLSPAGIKNWSPLKHV